MEEKKFEFDCSVTMLEYVALTSDIAEHFFDENGNYVPHYGELNAMRLFYNFCVDKSPYDLPEIIEDIADMKQLVEDGEFYRAFNDARYYDDHILSFGNAYNAAREIVSEKNSFAGGLRGLVSAINAALALLPDIMPDSETIDRLQSISEGISSGSLSASSIVNAYSTVLGNADSDGEQAETDTVVDIKDYKE